MKVLTNKIAALLFVPIFWILFLFITLLTISFKLLQINALRRYFRKGKKLSVLFLEVVTEDNAGYLYRSFKWQNILRQNNINSAVLTLLKKDKSYDQLLSAPYLVNVLFILTICKRCFQCLAALNANVVIVRRELLIYNDYGNLFMEKFLRSINENLILDFDDDISFAKREPRAIVFYGKLLIELPDKFNKSLDFYNYFIPGSTYLKKEILIPHSHIHEKNILTLPTLVDYNKFAPKVYDLTKKTITFGWSGIPGNFHNLPVILDALNKLSSTYEFDFVIISRYPFRYDTKFEMRFIKYDVNKTMEQLHHIDVGVMPLIDNKESRGKCGFKLIQYMGCGIVSIASAITVNNDIVDDKINGFLVYNETEWLQKLEAIIHLKKQFSEIGKRAFEKISTNYSFDTYTNQFIEFIKFVDQSN